MSGPRALGKSEGGGGGGAPRGGGMGRLGINQKIEDMGPLLASSE